LKLNLPMVFFLAGDVLADRVNHRSPLFCPFRANDSLGAHPPRAMPWAKLLRPFQGKGEKRNFKTGASGLCRFRFPRWRFGLKSF
jgi:hypothetical protein